MRRVALPFDQFRGWYCETLTPDGTIVAQGFAQQLPPGAEVHDLDVALLKRMALAAQRLDEAMRKPLC